MTARRVSYTNAYKIKVMKLSDEIGNRAAARENEINECIIRKWKRKREDINDAPKAKRANRGKDAKFPTLELELVEFVKEKRAAGIPISTIEIRLKASHSAKNTHHIPENDFKASRGWCSRFLQRSQLSIRRRTTICQRLPADFEDKLVAFQQYIIRLRQRHAHPLSQIGNADQTPLTFDLPSATTVCTKGSKKVTIKTTGNEKNRFTVMLACLADGSKLPPYIIFKRKTMPKEKFPAGVIVRVQEKGWMDDNLTMDWIKNVWDKRPGALVNRGMLVLDSFRCHKNDEVKEHFKNTKTDLVIIPGGMTSILQPLDVSLNKPMKDALRKKWTHWMMDGAHTFTATGRQRKVEMPTICEWILEAWNEIPIKSVVKSFKKCSISNALDGTEDDIIWEDEDNTPLSALQQILEDEDDLPLSSFAGLQDDEDDLHYEEYARD